MRRSLWLTSVLGLALLLGLPIVFATGLLSNAAYDPRLGANVELQGRPLGPFDFYLFHWPAHPVWLYAANEGVHVALGLALIPIVLSKLWSALIAAFRRPVGVVEVVERASVIFLVAAVVFEFGTGLLFIEYWWPFRFDFTSWHYYGAWVLAAAFVVHTAVRLPRMRQGLRTRRELLEPADRTSFSRRAFLWTTAGGSALLGLQGVAQSIGSPVRGLAFMLPRGSTLGSGPNDFPVNGTFASLGVGLDAIRDSWRLKLSGPDGRTHAFDRDQLLALQQHTYSLPIACREGWTTTQSWTGVRLRDLAAIVGVNEEPVATVGALDGASVAFAPNQVMAEQSLLALSVNGVPLSPDHGYPARVIVPAEIAMNCLKWVTEIAFAPAVSAPAPTSPRAPAPRPPRHNEGMPA